LIGTLRYGFTRQGVESSGTLTTPRVMQFGARYEF
jgi:hypothetical protein